MKEFCLIVWGAHHGRTSRKTARLVGSDWKIDGAIGLSEVARAVDFDKATTLRLLSPLAANGMVEKLEPIHRNRIGPMVLHLAGKREAIVPFAQSARPILEALSVEGQESSHLTEPSAGEMVIPWQSIAGPLMLKPARSRRRSCAATELPAQHCPSQPRPIGLAGAL
jgi:DNA-binding IclR family transcriptional regulator